MQDEKSQLQNKAKALRVLRSRILQAEQDRQAAEASEQRKNQMGGGGRSEKIRTYNFKENRVSDHRINMTVHNLDKVLAGELDAVSDALLHDDQQRRLAGDDNVVTEGRDQGTVVFPDARCKIFLTATPQERARRRMMDLHGRGEQVSLTQVLDAQTQRDRRDSSREVGRLVAAPDAGADCLA